MAVSETPVVLDWRDRSHYGGMSRRCTSCGQFTILLNDSGDPQHKVCAEAEIDESLGGNR
jgi:hypothetical protein